MADAIVPDQRAPRPVPNTTQGAENTAKRDYSAEYARREAIARAEGFPSYQAKRAAREGRVFPKPPRGRRPIDWAAVHARRDAQARAEGYASYWAKRKAQQQQRPANHRAA